jgi:hypothetical protein
VEQGVEDIEEKVHEDIKKVEVCLVDFLASFNLNICRVYIFK